MANPGAGSTTPVHKRIFHGESNTRMHSAWRGMFQRCYNPRNKHYAAYGARGIRVCERWQDYRNFIADMGERPAGKTLDRKDNDKDYCPENCKWSDVFEQAANHRIRRDNKFGCPGISKNPNTGKYVAVFSRFNRRVHIGSFTTAEEAVVARRHFEDNYNAFEDLTQGAQA